MNYQSDDSVLRWRAVAERTGLSRPSIWRAVRAGTFPQPFPLSPSGRAVGWSSHEISEWIERARSRRPRKAASATEAIAE